MKIRIGRIIESVTHGTGKITAIGKNDKNYYFTVTFKDGTTRTYNA